VTPFGGDFFILLVRLDTAHLCTKFDSSIASAIPEIWMGPPNLQVYLDRTTLFITKSTISHCTPSLITRQRASV